MVKKSTAIFAVLAMLAFGACTCWGYTVSHWPVPGISNTAFGPGSFETGHYQTSPNQIPLNYGGWYGYPGYYGGQYGGYGRGYSGRGWRR
jgi:hypothetical protein